MGARAWLREKLSGLPLEHEIDEAGNQWWTLRGASERAVLIGGHIDSVPNGGWLDGALNVMAGMEVVRRLAEDGEPAATVRLVDWADEEGAHALVNITVVESRPCRSIPVAPSPSCASCRS